MFFLEQELLPDKSATVVAENELETKILDLLRKKNLVDAVKLMPQIKAGDRLFELTREALEIAQSLRDSESVKQLVGLPFSKFHKDDFFILAIKSLLEFNQDAAICLVVFTKFSGVYQDMGWNILLEYFKTKADYQKLEIVYEHLKDEYNKKELSEYFLGLDEIRKDWLAWLTWYGRFYSVNKHQRNFELEAQALERLTAQRDIKVVIGLINQLFIEQNRPSFFERLYFYWLKTEGVGRCEQLEKSLPGELNWLKTVRELVTTGSNFEILSKITFAERDWVIPLAVSQLIRHVDEQNAVVPTLLARSAAVPECKYQIMQIACHICIESERVDVLIELLPHLDSYQAGKFIEKLMARVKLNDAQQARVLRLVVFEGSLWEKIKASFFTPLVDAESRRRAEESYQKVKKEYLGLKNIGSRNKKSLEICKELNKLIQNNLLDQAMQLCAVLAPSEQRNNYVDQLLTIVLQKEPIDFDLVNRVCQLYHDKAVAASWKNFFSAVRGGSNQEIIKASMKCKYNSIAQPFVSKAAIELLDEKELDASIEFLRNQGFLGSNWSRHDIETKVVDCLFSLYKDNIDRLIERIKSWMKKGAASYGPLVMSKLLEKNLLENAIRLLNSITANRDEEDFCNNQCLLLVKNYILEIEFSVNYFEILKKLSNMSVRNIFYVQICRLAFSKGPAFAFDIVKSCPDKEIRKEYLEELLSSCLIKSQFELAKNALNGLPQDLQLYWRPIVDNLTKKQFREVLSHWCATSRFDSRLTGAVMTNVLRDLSASAALEEFSDIHTVRQILAKDKPLTDEASFEDSLKRFTARQECDRILSMIVRHWCAQCLDVNKVSLQELFYGLNMVMPWYIESQQYDDLLTKIKKEVFLLMSNFCEIRDFLTQLIEHKKLENQDLDTCEKRFFDSNAFDELEALIRFASQPRFENWACAARLRLTTEYIKRKAFDDAVRFLPDNMNYAERRLLMDCVEQHLAALDLPRIQRVIDKLLVNAQESDVLPLVSYLLNSNYLTEGKLLFRRYVKTPTQVHDLSKKVMDRYWKKLSLLLGRDGESTMDFIRSSYHKIAQLKKALERNDDQEAIRLQSEIVQDMRRHLDIGFKGYCAIAFPNAADKYVYFPMVPTTEAGAPAERLQYLLRNYGFAQFQRDQPDMFAFLLSIQPAVSRGYSWLETLYPMNNEIKHQSNIAIDKVSSDFVEDLVNGVTTILLKLSNPLVALPELDQYKPSEFVDLRQLEDELSHRVTKHH